MLRNQKTSVTRIDLIVAVILLVLFVGYLYNLTGWRVFDDEGEYLYQVWRMTLGELPYVDFLTPQLPVFLFLGSLIMKLFGPSLFAMRLFSVILAFGSGLLIYLAGRRHHSALTGSIAVLLFLLHETVFKETRIYRNESLFIFLVTAGVVAATWTITKPRPKQLAIAGIFLGLATMVKLFGLLAAGGIGLWLIWDWWRAKRTFREFFVAASAFSVPLLLVLIGFVIAFSSLTPDFFDLVVGHHVAQGSESDFLTVFRAKIALFVEYLIHFAPLIIFSFASALIGFSRNDARQRWSWQLVTVLAFFALSRGLGWRHFMYLLPSITLLSGWLIAACLKGDYRNYGRIAAVVGLALMFIPWMRFNIDRASWKDQDTGKVITAIEQYTGSGMAILSDDIGLAFYSSRPTTYSGAALSHGAVTSGQITGELLIDEIVAQNVEMVIIDESLLTGNHMVFLRDYPRFHRFLENNFEPREHIRRDFQELVLWVRNDENSWRLSDDLSPVHDHSVQFGDFATLIGYDLAEEAVLPGDEVPLTLYFETKKPAENYWSIFTHLRDQKGELISQHDKVPYGGLYPPNRWWPGQIVDDKFSIVVPVGTPPGKYTITIGMYDFATGERVQLYSQDEEPVADNQITLNQSVTISDRD